jgi:hypothetical protein
LLPLAVSAQATLDGFLGIPWGASLLEAKTQMLARKGVSVDDRLTNPDALICGGGFFNGKPVWRYALLLVDNRFCHGQVICTPSPGLLIFEYRDWVADLTAKFGRPTNVWDSSPLRDGDDRLPDAVRAGKATYATAWEFPAGDRAANSIAVEINDALLLTISYENGDLMAERVRKQKATFGRDL